MHSGNKSIFGGTVTIAYDGDGNRVSETVGENTRMLFQRFRSAIADAEAKNPMRELLGVTLSSAMDAFVFAYSMAILLVYLVRQLQTETSASGWNAILQFPIRFLCTTALVGWWVYVLGRWFRYIGWPRWWALLYVLLVLCPWTWVFANRIEIGGDSLALLLLQAPIIGVYVWRVRSRTKPRRDSQ